MFNRHRTKTGPQIHTSAHTRACTDALRSVDTCSSPWKHTLTTSRHTEYACAHAHAYACTHVLAGARTRAHACTHTTCTHNTRTRTSTFPEGALQSISLPQHTHTPGSAWSPHAWQAPSSSPGCVHVCGVCSVIAWVAECSSCMRASREPCARTPAALCRP